MPKDYILVYTQSANISTDVLYPSRQLLGEYEIVNKNQLLLLTPCYNLTFMGPSSLINS